MSEILEALEASAEGGDSDADDMIARLAERLGITDDDDEDDDDESGIIGESQTAVKVNAFSGEGGSN